MKKKRTPEERERYRLIQEDSRAAHRYVREVMERIDRTILAHRSPPPPPPDRFA
jgi:hypothetical protein